MKKIIKILLCLVFLFCSIYFIDDYYNKEKVNEETKVIKKIENFNETVDMTSLKNLYNNDDIVLYLEIPGLFEIPIVKTNDNEFYLSHDIFLKESKFGWPFLDYRNDLSNDKKLLIYGHNSTKQELEFTNLIKYENEDFYKENKYINIYTENEKKTYEIFSSYVENEDFDYVNLNDFNGLTYLEHIKKLKNKSIYQTDVELNEDSNIIILQTCTFNNSYSGNQKYHLVIGVERDELKNE